MDQVRGEEEEVGGGVEEPVGLLVLQVDVLLLAGRVERVEAALGQQMARQAPQPEDKYLQALHHQQQEFKDTRAII